MPLTQEQKQNIAFLLLVSSLLVFLSGWYALKTHNDARKESGSRPHSLYEFLELDADLHSVLVGAASGVVFGFIDNAGLFFGMSALDPLLPAGELTRAGMGNTFSDALGSFLSTFVGSILMNKTQVYSPPIWSEAIGIIVGCLLGIAIPRAITGKV